MKKTAQQAVTEKEYREACKKHAKALAEADRLTADKKKRLTEVEQSYTKPMEKQTGIINDTYNVIKQYCEHNRDEMFTDAKSTDTGYGVLVGFRVNPPKLEYAEGVTAEQLLEVLKRKGLKQYIVTKETVDTRAIVKAEDKKLGNALQGVGCGVTQTEEFFVKPS